MDAYSSDDPLHAGFEWYRTFPTDAKQNQSYAESEIELPVLALQDGVLPSVGEMMDGVATNVRQSTPEQAGHFIADE